MNQSIIDDCWSKLHIYRLWIKGPRIPSCYKEYLLMSITGSGENEDAVHAGSKIKVTESK